LGLLAALENDDIPIVFADGGICYAPDYAGACRMFRRKGKTIYTGRLEKDMLVSAYRAAKAHVLPSWYELPGLVTLEAALYGCNVAASPHGGIREYLGEQCRYFEPGDLEGMRQAALRCLEAPKSGAAGILAREFTWEKSVEAVHGLYREVMTGIPRPREKALA
jgi:glycosyltransferase involved in cell wall biosynthesis